jgi:hypothetical protein
MANFLLWNVQQKPLDPLVARIVDEHRIDVVLLVEYPLGGTFLPEPLGSRGFVKVASHRRFGVFSNPAIRFEPVDIVSSSDRANYWRCLSQSGMDGFLALVHGFDERNKKDGTRAGQFRRITENLRILEKQFGHKRTLIAGDFNANPFDSAVVSAEGMHAIGVRSLRGRSDRTYLSEPSDFFYNPMWRVYGHGIDAGAATHHYHGYDAYELIWHMTDQVVLRPEALDLFPEDELRILGGVGEESFTDRFGVPDREAASDHLPIAFAWNL